VREDPVTKNVTVRYSTPKDGVKEEEFDMVVLSVGLNPPVDVKTLSEKFGIDLNDHEFAKLNPINPMETNRKGIFVSGGLQGPIDIPESVFSASGAGSQIGELLDYRRGNLSKERIYPEERDVSQEEPRIGVFVCHCGANIGRIVNVPATVEYCKTLPNVVYAQEQLFSCATNSAKQITDITKEQNLNRVVVAACSPGLWSLSSATPCGRRASTSTITRWPTSGSTTLGSTRKRRKRPPRRPRTSSACRLPAPASLSPSRSSTCRSTRGRWSSAAASPA
jgi:heterodisulfide reductase subunit A